MIILLIVVIFEGCFLVRYFSRFTEEIFGCLISAIFIYEAINFLVKVRHFTFNCLAISESSNGLELSVET
jgi:hypothetical protein